MTYQEIKPARWEYILNKLSDSVINYLNKNNQAFSFAFSPIIITDELPRDEFDFVIPVHHSFNTVMTTTRKNITKWCINYYTDLFREEPREEIRMRQEEIKNEINEYFLDLKYRVYNKHAMRTREEIMIGYAKNP